MRNTVPVTLLLVEDDQVDVKAVRRAFGELRIANPLVVAKDGMEALDALRGKNGKKKLKRPYLVLLDLNMPRMSGIEFLDELRKDSSLDETVVFVLTTSEAERDRAQAYDKHVSGYLLKQRAGPAFVDAISMLEHYWRIVEFPAG
jgi:CheY-like chemotaxis protein